ncbi:DHA2 family efflux MFS transporter permease subunit [Aquincola sp. MAHUQ-54]|uniref:DHA2 family efflux MFS transporter permease subunit n=1 Tax=Aquincola agrisoli TaxID=3119538 RepID=A0AAW9QNS7_9BURK
MSSSAEALAVRHGPNYRWWVLVAVMVGTMASIMSSTIVNVAVPDMSDAFTLGQERAQWMSAGFMAAMTVSMLVTPWLLDRFGLRGTYVGVTLLLMLGGIGGGLGRSYEWVLAMRVAEGLAAGIMQPIPAIVVMRIFGPHEQGKAMGVFGMGSVLAPAIGPSIGGVLVEHFGWRSIFFVVVPFCVVALLLARRYLPSRAAPHEDALPARLDVWSLGLIAMAIVALLNGMVELREAEAGVPLLAIVLLAAAAAGIVAFVLLQRRAAQPLMAPALFGYRAFAMGGCVAFIYGMALFGSTYLVPVFMQTALRLPPSQAGAVLFPAGIALAITIPWGGRLADRVPVHRLVTLGILLLAASFALMLTVSLGTALAVIALWAVVGRVGLGFVLPSLNLGAVRAVEPALIAQGASVINFLRQLGGAVGVSLTGIVLEWRLQAHGAGLGSGSTAGQLAAFHEAFAMLALVTAVAAAAAWRMRAAPGAGKARS